jgi:hypothetical protein
VQIVVHALNGHSPNLLVSNATKLFSPRHYTSDDSDQITNIEQWIKRILLKFKYTTKESDICKREILEFEETL